MRLELLRISPEGEDPSKIAKVIKSDGGLGETVDG